MSTEQLSLLHQLSFHSAWSADPFSATLAMLEALHRTPGVLSVRLETAQPLQGIPSPFALSGRQKAGRQKGSGRFTLVGSRSRWFEVCKCLVAGEPGTLHAITAIRFRAI